MRRLIPLSLQLLLVALIASFFCVYRLGENSFGAGDQTIHSKVVQEMVQKGNFLTPTRHGRAYFNKPPFKMWLTAGAVKVLGESNFSYRIVDALTGIAITASVFLFAVFFFGSSLAGWFSALALLSSPMFFFGHGVRVAVQDGMLLFLTTCALIAGWHFAQTSALPLFGIEARRRLWKLGAVTGICIGLAVLTKSVAGFIGLIILGAYIAVSGKAVLVLKRAFGPLMLMGALSIIIPSLYLLPRLITNHGMFSLMFNHEFYKRAVVGYHHVRDTWLYVHVIFKDSRTMPSLLVAAALLYCAWRIAKRRDERWIFLLCWAAAPVVLYTFVKSKLDWYIMPSLPALAMLCGGTMDQACRFAIERLNDLRLFRRRPAAATWLALFFVAASLVLILRGQYKVSKVILQQYKRRPPDVIVQQALRDYGPNQPRPLVIAYRKPDLSVPERFYWEMLGVREINRPEELKEALATGQYKYVLAMADRFEEVYRQGPISGYLNFGPWHTRRRRLAIISYESRSLPAMLRRAVKTVGFADKDLPLTHGWRRSSDFHGLKVRVAYGKKAGFLLDVDSIQRRFGAIATLRAASTVEEATGGMRLTVFVNDVLKAQFIYPRGGFVDNVFEILPEDWENGLNHIGFAFERLDGKQITEQDEPFIAQYLRLDLRRDLKE